MSGAMTKISESLIAIPFKYLRPEANAPLKSSTKSVKNLLKSVKDVALAPNCVTKVETGLAMAIPHGYYGRIVALRNETGFGIVGGVIDADYRGDIGVLIANYGSQEIQIKAGQLVASIIIESVPVDIQLELAE